MPAIRHQFLRVGKSIAIRITVGRQAVGLVNHLPNIALLVVDVESTMASAPGATKQEEEHAHLHSPMLVIIPPNVRMHFGSIILYFYQQMKHAQPERMVGIRRGEEGICRASFAAQGIPRVAGNCSGARYSHNVRRRFVKAVFTNSPLLERFIVPKACTSHSLIAPRKRRPRITIPMDPAPRGRNNRESSDAWKGGMGFLHSPRPLCVLNRALCVK